MSEHCSVCSWPLSSLTASALIQHTAECLDGRMPGGDDGMDEWLADVFVDLVAKGEIDDE